MKKKIILAALIFLVVIACTIFLSFGWLYLMASLMFLAILGTIWRNKTRVMKMTRWAKANPLKAQVLIIVLQIALMVLGIIAGYNFNKLGYEFPGSAAFVFSTILVTGFLSVHFLPKRSTIAIPKEVNKNRVVYVSIALSSFIMMVLTGNRIEEKFPNSPITHALAAIDLAIFPESSTTYDERGNVVWGLGNHNNFMEALAEETNAMAAFASYSVNENETIKPPAYSKKEIREKLKAEKKAAKLKKKKAKMLNQMEKFRKAFGAGLGAGAILLIVLLVITTCAGVCLFIAGFSGSAGLIPLGAAIAAGSIWGIIKITKGDKQKNKEKP